MSNDNQKPPPIQPPRQMPPPGYQDGPSQPNIGDALIPAKNPNALVSYYLGLFSIIPCFGLAMGVIAFVTGRRALAAAKLNPNIKGETHAKFGIGCGLVGLLFNLLIIVPLAIALITHLK